ncbi:glycoside hydrolase family 3 C-terminal domain-containing protein [[Clostridium] polysaccharolyticum]|uniref:Beta-glucosidase n=1 Tax=[Clostridium] polysaccharolyticum TaxID=29364 RepID=A0A1I0EIZ3_9FIRM|nr:beta-glucosidase [[Clostridium] polysaccharolyticum]
MDVKKVIQQMTLEEKAGICSGSDFWHTKAVERLGIPQMMVSDGPHGLRKQDLESDHLGINESIKAVCFPAGCATAASFDRDLLYSMGQALGNECQAEGVAVILGPAVNIKRSPLCGRNFEYYSEDPYLATEIAASHIKGVQSKNVGTSIKHFLANNQEHRRMSSSSEVDERTLRELYLAAFEGAIKEAKPWTVMCAYNRINGVYAAENKTYLTDVLRDEWGYEGMIISDWGAVNNRVADLAAGLDLEMPSSSGLTDKMIVEAVQNGTLDEAVLDKAVENILNVVERFESNRDTEAVFDRDADHALARKVAQECIVLLKNEDVLPLKTEESVAIIGEFAKAPRYQGGGSSHINSHKVESVWEILMECDSCKDKVYFAQGYSTKEDIIDEKKIAQAVELAKQTDKAVLFAGLPDSYESEGFDRSHMKMPEGQNALIEAVAEANPNTIVVLHNGSPVEMPWADKVSGIIEAYLGGQAIGGAVADVLYGKVNPSGHLAESFPIKLEDNPSYLYYHGEGDRVEYREGVFAGYRYYDTKKMEVRFPFGHGLSYTAFVYSNVKLSEDSIRDTDSLEVSVDVTNTGDRAGKEVVQLYVAPPKDGRIIRPVHELKGFEKVFLEPGETKTVTFTLSKRAFAYYETKINDWHVETGKYTIELGQSSRKILAECEVQVESTRRLPLNINLDTLFGDIQKIPGTEKILEPFIKIFTEFDMGGDDKLGSSTKEMMESMLRDLPLRGLVSFVQGKVSYQQLYDLMEQLNYLLFKIG